jgi:hypothetical protein
MLTYLLILTVSFFSSISSSKWLNNNLLTTKNKPIIYVPGLGGSIIYDDNNYQIWPPSLFSILKSGDFEKKLSVNNKLEPLYFTKTASLFNSNQNGNDKDGIKVINGAIANLITNKFGEHILEFFYKKSHPVYAFPYDFRIVPNLKYMDELNNSMKESIEYIYRENSKKVVIITHSLGSLIMMNFFNTNSKEWNEKYIDTVICINPPFNGSILALKILLLNKLNINIKEIDLEWIKNFGGLIWCLPDLSKLANNILNIDGKDIENIIDYLPKQTQEIYNKYFLNNKLKINQDINLHIINSFGENTPSKLYLKKEGMSLRPSTSDMSLRPSTSDMSLKPSTSDMSLRPSTSDINYIFDKYDYIDGDGVILTDYIKDIFGTKHQIIGEHSNILMLKNLLDKINEIIK